MKSPLCSLGFGRTTALPAVHVTVRLAATKPISTTTTSYAAFPHFPRCYTNLFVSNSKYSCTRRIPNQTTRANFDTFFPSGEYENSRDTEKNTIKRAIAATTKSIILACMIGLIGLGLGANMARCAPIQALAVAPGTKVSSTGGLSAKYAVISLMEVSNYLSSKEGNKWGSRHIGAWFGTKSEIEDPHKGPSKKNVDELKKEAMQQLKLGKSQEAEKILKDEYERWKDYSESAYYIDMALVEILISQGKYGEAKGRECLNKKPDGPSDPRIPLYKAIIYTVENDPRGEEMAIKYWDEFLKTIRAEVGRQQS